MRGENVKELLSAFLDDALSEHEERRLWRALASDRELRATWERYHLVQQVLRNELGPVLGPGFAERVDAALRLSGPAGARRVAPWRPVARWAGLFAVAASAAALTLFGWQAAVAPPAAPTPPARAQLESAAPTGVVAATARGPDGQTAKRHETETALDFYLVEHNEFAPTSGVSGVLPYVRVVGYDSER